MTSRPGPGVYTISIRLGDVSQLIITVTISLNVIGALAALFFCNWTVEAANHTKSTQLNPPITELITITIETTTYLEKKTSEFPKWRNFFTLDIVSTGDAYAKCFRFFFRKL